MKTVKDKYVLVAADFAGAPLKNIGSDIGVWRNLYDDTSEAALDRAAEEYGKFIRQAFAK